MISAKLVVDPYEGEDERHKRHTYSVKCVCLYVKRGRYNIVNDLNITSKNIIYLELVNFIKVRSLTKDPCPHVEIFN